jgi:broad specificity phosphatase PhoE
MPTNFLFIRHAETDLAGTFCGTTDPPLNERGREQLKRLVARLDGFPLDAIYTSDLQRATATATALAAVRDTSIHLRPGLRQIDFGRWETLTWEQIEQADAAFAARWVAEFPNLPPPGGEPIPHFKNRVLAEIDFIRQQSNGGTVAVVTHSTVLRVLLEELGHFAPHHAWEKTRDYTCTIRATQSSATGSLNFL